MKDKTVEQFYFRKVTFLRIEQLFEQVVNTSQIWPKKI